MCVRVLPGVCANVLASAFVSISKCYVHCKLSCLRFDLYLCISTAAMYATKHHNAQNLRAITIRDPFASAILFGTKAVDNHEWRFRLCDVDGAWLVVHAAQSESNLTNERPMCAVR